MYTARVGVYMRALEEKANIPTELPRDSAASFHCSPAARINADGSFTMGAVTATASVRFAKPSAKLVVSKGGISPETSEVHFVRYRTIYLTTVGYNTGPGRESVEWRDLSVAAE